MRDIIISLTILVVFYGCATKKETTVPQTSDIDLVRIEKPIYLWAFKPNINIRENYEATAAKVGQLADGDSVEILTNEAGWYQVRLKDDQLGWIRSDLLGPRNLSAFRQAVYFVDSIKVSDNINLFFDKNLYHKRIYLQYPENVYTSKDELENRTRILIKTYQEKVYAGEVTVRVLKPESDQEYSTLTVNGKINSEPILPVTPFGWIQKINRPDPQSIHLFYQVPFNVSDNNLLAAARSMVEKFPLSFSNVELIFTSKTENKDEICRLWFHEGQTGEDYQINKCP